nr:hypothetical protein [Tanacetum cinerariifolium]
PPPEIGTPTHPGNQRASGPQPAILLVAAQRAGAAGARVAFRGCGEADLPGQRQRRP